MAKRPKNTVCLSTRPSAFSLVELLCALTIGALVISAVLGIYNRARRSAESVVRNLADAHLPSDVLQFIAEDLDEVIAAGESTKITVQNKYDHGYATARLEILTNIYNRRNQPEVFKKIIWQTDYDYEGYGSGLVLYRSHSGLALEDKVLDVQKEDWERELFVPICTGVTFFRIQVPTGKILQDSYTGKSLPKGIVATVSFAEPYKTLENTWDVPETRKITRTIALDRTRKLGFKLARIEEPNETEEDQQQEEEEDANDLEEEPNDVEQEPK